MAANGVLNEMWTTSRARLGMRGSIKVRFPDFRSVTFTFSSSLLKVPIKKRKHTSLVNRVYVYLLVFSAHISDSPYLGWIAACDIQLCYILCSALH